MKTLIRSLNIVPRILNEEQGTVEFTAVYRDGAGRGRLHELSRFVREGGRWFYVDGDLD